jgi:hypothetical protein
LNLHKNRLHLDARTISIPSAQHKPTPVGGQPYCSLCSHRAMRYRNSAASSTDGEKLSLTFQLSHLIGRPCNSLDCRPYRYSEGLLKQANSRRRQAARSPRLAGDSRGEKKKLSFKWAWVVFGSLCCQHFCQIRTTTIRWRF